MKQQAIHTIRQPGRLRERFFMALPMILYGAVYLLWWSRLEQTNLRHYSEIHSVIDDMIPFVEIFIVPYLLWFGYCLFTVLYFLFGDDKEEYARVLAFLGFGMTLFLVISTLFPNELHLRPAYLPRDNIFTRMVAGLYARDTSTNVFPSIHVYNAIGCHLALSYSERSSLRTKRLSLVLCISIVLSTMFLKQHSVYDVLGAMALCVVADYLVYRTSLVKFVNLSHQLVTADGDKSAALAGQVDQISHSRKAHS